MNHLLTVLPFHPGDSAQAARTLDWLADLSGQQQRTLVLAHEEQCPAQEVQRAASRAFAKVEHLAVTACANAWPLSANCYFGQIAFSMRGRAPWLLFESDVTLIHPQALDMLEADYVRSGRPCLGSIIPAYVLKNGQWIENGKMLAGVAVYHPNLWDNSPLLRSLGATQAAYAAWNKKNPDKKAAPKAFDCYLAPEILPGAGETPLIQHMGRSRDFRRDGGQIVCSYGPESRWSPVVAPQTVLVHGCKDGSLINLLRAEMGIPAGKREPAAPAVIVSATPMPRATVADGFRWEDDKPTAKPPEPPVVAKSATVPQRPPVANHEALATLADARLAIQHWPDCQQVLLSLQEQKGRARFRVVCQCGANSPKLPEGVDWMDVWNQAASMMPDKAPAANPDYPKATHEAGPTGFPQQRGNPAENLDPAVYFAQEGSTVLDSEKKPCIDPLNPYTGDVSVRSIMENVANGHTDFPHGAGDTTTKIVVANEDPLPLHKLRAKRDIIKRFPELGKLLPGQFKRRWNQIKKADREAKLKPELKAIEAKSARLLTEPARARKMELLEMCRGKQGAFLKLRRHAEGLGLTHTKAFKKDALIIAVLEKEFGNPYEEFAEATA